MVRGLGPVVLPTCREFVVAHAVEPTPVWSSRSSGKPGAYFLQVRPDSNLAVYPGFGGES